MKHIRDESPLRDVPPAKRRRTEEPAAAPSDEDEPAVADPPELYLPSEIWQVIGNATDDITTYNRLLCTCKQTYMQLGQLVPFMDHALHVETSSTKLFAVFNRVLRGRDLFPLHRWQQLTRRIDADYEMDVDQVVHRATLPGIPWNYDPYAQVCIAGGFIRAQILRACRAAGVGGIPASLSEACGDIDIWVQGDDLPSPYGVFLPRENQLICKFIDGIEAKTTGKWKEFVVKREHHRHYMYTTDYTREKFVRRIESETPLFLNPELRVGIGAYSGNHLQSCRRVHGIPECCSTPFHAQRMVFQPPAIPLGFIRCFDISACSMGLGSPKSRTTSGTWLTPLAAYAMLTGRCYSLKYCPMHMDLTCWQFGTDVILETNKIMAELVRQRLAKYAKLGYTIMAPGLCCAIAPTRAYPPLSMTQLRESGTASPLKMTSDYML